MENIFGGPRTSNNRALSSIAILATLLLASCSGGSSKDTYGDIASLQTAAIVAGLDCGIAAIEEMDPPSRGSGNNIECADHAWLEVAPERSPDEAWKSAQTDLINLLGPREKLDADFQPPIMLVGQGFRVSAKPQLLPQLRKLSEKGGKVIIPTLDDLYNSDLRWDKVSTELTDAPASALSPSINPKTGSTENPSQNSAEENENPIPARGNKYGGLVFDSLEQGKQQSYAKLGPIELSILKDYSGRGVVEPRGLTRATDAESIPVIVYSGTQCSHCDTFWDSNGSELQRLLKEGTITLEIRNGFLGASVDALSRVNSLACASDQGYETYSAVMQKLQEKSDSVQELGLPAYLGEIEPETQSCIESGKYNTFAEYAQRASTYDGIIGFPTALVNGQIWDPEAEVPFQSFLKTELAKHTGP